MDNNVFNSPKNLLHYFLKPYYGVFLGLIVLGPLSVISGQLILWQTAQIINLISANTDKAIALKTFLPMFYELVLLTIITSASGLLSFLLLQIKCLGPAGISIRQELFSEMLKKDHRFFNTYAPGDIWSKIDITKRSIAAHSSLGELFWQYLTFCTILSIFYFLFKIYWVLVFVLGAAGGLMLLILNYISDNIKKVSVQSAKFEALVLEKVVNTLANFFILKTFGTEKREQKKLEKEFDNFVKAKQKKAMAENVNLFAIKGISLLFECTILLYAVYLWTEHKIYAGDIVYVMTAVMSFSEIMKGASQIVPFFKSRMAVLKNNIDIFAKKNEIDDIKGAKRLKISNGIIEIKELRFSYNQDREIFNGLSLFIKPKEKVGIVGESGSGKTTLIYLLQRLINTPKGTIFIDGQDICQVTEESLHQALSFIPQDTSLFHRTVLENIKYGKMTATDRTAKEAAKSASADEFIKIFPLGYQTLVGDKGVKLSGGERQRISIARAILKNAPILILDEATSALDSVSEDYIQKAINEIIKDKTVIAIAHRLSTLKNMDRIIVLEKGKIVEDGKPSVLLKQKGKFYKFWTLQKG